MHVSVLIELGLVLFGLTILINAVARLLSGGYSAERTAHA